MLGSYTQLILELPHFWKRSEFNFCAEFLFKHILPAYQYLPILKIRNNPNQLCNFETPFAETLHRIARMQLIGNRPIALHNIDRTCKVKLEYDWCVCLLQRIKKYKEMNWNPELTQVCLCAHSHFLHAFVIVRACMRVNAWILRQRKAMWFIYSLG